MSSLTQKSRAGLRLLAVTGTTGALVAAMACLAPTASASTIHDSVPLPVVCDSTGQNVAAEPNPSDPGMIEFTGSGTITCLAPGGGLIEEGTTHFSGTIPKETCTGTASRGVYRGEVDWSDGTVTSGTLDNFHKISVNGVDVTSFNGTTDASSTRFPGYAASVNGLVIGSCASPASAAGETDIGTVIYTP